MKITKTLAHNVAVNMCKETIDERKRLLGEDLSVYSYVVVEKQINPTIKEAFGKFADYFKTSQYVNLKCGDLPCIGVSLSKQIPTTNGYNPMFEIKRDEYEVVRNLKDHIDRVSDERGKLKAEIEGTLNSLGTLKRVQEQFPEAIEYFPKDSLPSEVTAVALPIENIKETLLKYKSKTK